MKQDQWCTKEQGLRDAPAEECYLQFDFEILRFTPRKLSDTVTAYYFYVFLTFEFFIYM
jgi:hypothetical protein